MCLSAYNQNWQLEWSDEFNSTSLDLENWNYETGTGVNGDFGTGQLDRATDRPENVDIEQGIQGADGGALRITTRKEFYIDRDYTSGRINTQSKQAFGPNHRIVARVWPQDVRNMGQGFAFWMMPNEIMNDGFEGIHSFYEKQSKKYGFEIDIPESAYFRLASKYFNEGDKKKAFEIAKEYVAKFPASSYAHYYLGMRAKAVGELRLAKKSFLKAIEIEESSLEPYSERIVWSNYFLQEIEKELEKKL